MEGHRNIAPFPEAFQAQWLEKAIKVFAYRHTESGPFSLHSLRCLYISENAESASRNLATLLVPFREPLDLSNEVRERGEAMETLGVIQSSMEAPCQAC